MKNNIIKTSMSAYIDIVKYFNIRFMVYDPSHQTYDDNKNAWVVDGPNWESINFSSIRLIRKAEDKDYDRDVCYPQSFNGDVCILECCGNEYYWVAGSFKKVEKMFRQVTKEYNKAVEDIDALRKEIDTTSKNKLIDALNIINN